MRKSNLFVVFILNLILKTRRPVPRLARHYLVLAFIRHYWNKWENHSEHQDSQKASWSLIRAGRLDTFQWIRKLTKKSAIGIQRHTSSPCVTVYVTVIRITCRATRNHFHLIIDEPKFSFLPFFCFSFLTPFSKPRGQIKSPFFSLYIYYDIYSDMSSTSFFLWTLFFFSRYFCEKYDKVWDVVTCLVQ